MAKRRQAGRRAARRTEPGAPDDDGRGDNVGGDVPAPPPPAGRDPAATWAAFPDPSSPAVATPEPDPVPRRPVPIVIPSVAELALYGTLATTVAVAVMIVNDRPRWQAAAVVAGAALVIVLLSVVAARSRPERTGDEADEGDGEPTRTRSGARRRRRR